jgi:methionine biosynthesis protein MetW
MSKIDRAENIRHVAKNMRVDLRLIAEMIAPGTRVLDIGCGECALIDELFRSKGCDARGLEIDMAEVTRAVAHGMPVMHGDADTDLAHYPDGAFDYVVLSRTLQAVERPREVLRWSVSPISVTGRCACIC